MERAKRDRGRGGRNGVIDREIVFLLQKRKTGRQRVRLRERVKEREKERKKKSPSLDCI